VISHIPVGLITAHCGLCLGLDAALCGLAKGPFAVTVDRSLRLDQIGLGEPMMQPRESSPLWVWLTLVLIAVATAMYLTGYFMIEDLLAYFK
jgi:hypothetical protein